MFTQSLRVTLTEGSDVVSQTTETVQADSAVGYDDTVVHGGGYKEIDLAFKFATIKSMIIVASVDMSLKTNANDGTADNTFALKANIPVVWTVNNLGVCPITADVTKLYVNNAGAANGTLRIRVLNDDTP